MYISSEGIRCDAQSGPRHLPARVDLEQHPPKMPSLIPAFVQPEASTSGLTKYYTAKVEAAEQLINTNTQNLRRLEAQRNALNARVRLLKEELQLLQEPGSYVGEVVKVMGKKKASFAQSLCLLPHALLWIHRFLSKYSQKGNM